MAISTRGELQTALANFTSRTAFATANFSNWLSLAEARLNRALTNIRLQHVVASLTGTLNSRNLALPSDYRAPIALFLTTYGPRTKLTPMLAGVNELATAASAPTAWQIQGANIELSHPCDLAHTFLFNYRAEWALGSGSTDTNWLLTKHPDCYLYSCLAAAFTQMRHLEAATAYLGLMQMAIDEISKQEARSEALALLTIDPMLVGVGGSGADVSFPVDSNALLVD